MSELSELLRSARSLLESGQAVGAMALARAALQIAPDDPDALEIQTVCSVALAERERGGAEAIHAEPVADLPRDVPATSSGNSTLERAAATIELPAMDVAALGLPATPSPAPDEVRDDILWPEVFRDTAREAPPPEELPVREPEAAVAEALPPIVDPPAPEPEPASETLWPDVNEPPAAAPEAPVAARADDAPALEEEGAIAAPLSEAVPIPPEPPADPAPVSQDDRPEQAITPQAGEDAPGPQSFVETERVEVVAPDVAPPPVDLTEPPPVVHEELDGVPVPEEAPPGPQSFVETERVEVVAPAVVADVVEVVAPEAVAPEVLVPPASPDPEPRVAQGAPEKGVDDELWPQLPPHPEPQPEPPVARELPPALDFSLPPAPRPERSDAPSPPQMSPAGEIVQPPLAPAAAAQPLPARASQAGEDKPRPVSPLERRPVSLPPRNESSSSQGLAWMGLGAIALVGGVVVTAFLSWRGSGSPDVAPALPPPVAASPATPQPPATPSSTPVVDASPAPTATEPPAPATPAAATPSPDGEQSPTPEPTPSADVATLPGTPSDDDWARKHDEEMKRLEAERSDGTDDSGDQESQIAAAEKRVDDLKRELRNSHGPGLVPPTEEERDKQRQLEDDLAAAEEELARLRGD